MNYIIFDLEWNNAYNKTTKKGMNEIIEIGAIKLDEGLQHVSSFSQIVKPVLSLKLASRVKDLTHITNDDILSGIKFADAMDLFADWAGGGANVFLSWSNSDLYVLAECDQHFASSSKIGFIKKYMDLQSYCQSFMTLENNNQISLINAAAMLEIDSDETNLHRALTDCLLAAKCFKKLFDAKKVNARIQNCDKTFFERLLFKSYFIRSLEIAAPILHKKSFYCPNCKLKLQIKEPFKVKNQLFFTSTKCGKCKQDFYVSARLKQNFSKIDFKPRVVPLKKY